MVYMLALHYWQGFKNWEEGMHHCTEQSQTGDMTSTFLLYYNIVSMCA